MSGKTETGSSESDYFFKMCCCGCRGCFVLTENITFSCFFHSSLPRSAVTVNCAVCVFPQIIKKSWLTVFVSEHKVIIVGLDNAGKTTILYQFLMNEVVHTSPTIGSNVEEIVVKNTHFLMWDIGGQESLRSSWNTYYSNTEFIILVVDSTDRERLAISKEELYRMLAHEDLRKAAVLIFANKQDMKDCMSAAEISKYLTLSSIKDHPWHIQSCCALTGEGLCQGLEWMTSRAGLR
ncbi:ADP-ribosylation factor-like 8 isoform X1 [Xiphophorus hellerii]|uniref:ADP-ribosylation factor-like 8 isoform X1 n=2 Tax=Teleostei TaxID=32443 RepID=UPI0013B3C724|nr:ADP-ribosylation factor-like protein 5B isoform X1 [Xiphophorus hellerii]